MEKIRSCNSQTIAVNTNLLKRRIRFVLLTAFLNCKKGESKAITTPWTEVEDVASDMGLHA